MAILREKCEVIALGNVAAEVKEPSPARPQALQRGGGHPTSTNTGSSERLTI
jgi:hypothetical protein